MRGENPLIPRPASRRPEVDFGALAQLGERLHGMQEVRGSIPLGSTKLQKSWLAFQVIPEADRASPHMQAKWPNVARPPC